MQCQEYLMASLLKNSSVDEALDVGPTTLASLPTAMSPSDSCTSLVATLAQIDFCYCQLT